MSRTRRCSEAFTAQGAWWDPAEPERQLAGVLRWDPTSGGELELVGFFPAENGVMGDWRGDVLHGVADRDEFTLLNCAEMGFQIQTPGVATQRIRPFDGVLVGARVPDVSQPMFDRLILEVDYVAELAQRSTPTVAVESTDGIRVERVSIEYEHPRDVVAVLTRETVRLASEWSTGGSTLGNVRIEETVVLWVETTEPLPLDELLRRYVARLRDLVTLAAQRPATIRSVRVAGPATTEAGADGHSVKRAAQFLARFLPEPSPTDDLKRLEAPLFRFPNGDGNSGRYCALGSNLMTRLVQSSIFGLRLAMPCSSMARAGSLMRLKQLRLSIDDCLTKNLNRPTWMPARPRSLSVPRSIGSGWKGCFSTPTNRVCAGDCVRWGLLHGEVTSDVAGFRTGWKDVHHAQALSPRVP